MTVSVPPFPDRFFDFLMIVKHNYFCQNMVCFGGSMVMLPIIKCLCICLPMCLGFFRTASSELLGCGSESKRVWLTKCVLALMELLFSPRG